MPKLPVPYAIRVQLGAHRRLFNYALEMLADHIDTVERDLDRRRQELERNLAKEAERLSERNKTDLGDIYANEFHKLAELFPTLHRRAYLVIILGELENYLNDLCAYTKHAQKLEIGVADLNGRGIKRAVTYLRKAVGVKVPQSGEWNEITIAQDIRNLIVHKGGQLSRESPVRIREYATISNHMKLSNRDEIVLAEGYLPALLKHIHQFANELKAAMGQTLAHDA